MPDCGPDVRCGHEPLVEVRLLCEQPDPQVAPPLHLAGVGLVGAGHDPEQRRLARAVRAHEADPLPHRDRCVDPVEDHEGADLADHARQADDRHQRPCPRSGPTRGCRSTRALGPRTSFVVRQPDRAVALPAARSTGFRAEPASPSVPSPGSASRPRGRRPAAAGTTSRSAWIGSRARSAGSVARSADMAPRRAGRPAGAPASRRRPRAPCSRQSTSRGRRPPRPARRGSPCRGGGRRRATASPPTGADAGASATALRRRRCCRSRRGRPDRSAAS